MFKVIPIVSATSLERRMEAAADEGFEYLDSTETIVIMIKRPVELKW